MEIKCTEYTREDGLVMCRLSKVDDKWIVRMGNRCYMWSPVINNFIFSGGKTNYDEFTMTYDNAMKLLEVIPECSFSQKRQ